MKQQFTNNLLKAVIVFGAILFINAQTANAKIWRVNNNVGVTADYAQPQAAHDAASAGDTLHIESSPSSYNSLYLRKRLVVMGLGYWITTSYNSAGFTYNSGLQASANEARLPILIDSTASGSIISGIALDYIFFGNDYTYADNVTITRCYIGSIGVYRNATPMKVGNLLSNITVSKCFINNNTDFDNVNLQNLNFINNVSNGSLYCRYGKHENILVRNNNFGNTYVQIEDLYFANNIIYHIAYFARTNCTVKNNTFLNGSVTDATDIAFGNNTMTETNAYTKTTGAGGDAYYQPTAAFLNAGNTTSDGETVSGVTPKRGAFATADPYRLSGLPAIPSIYQLTVPVSVPSTATGATITISTKSNN